MLAAFSEDLQIAHPGSLAGKMRSAPTRLSRLVALTAISLRVSIIAGVDIHIFHSHASSSSTTVTMSSSGSEAVVVRNDTVPTWGVHMQRSRNRRQSGS